MRIVLLLFGLKGRRSKPHGGDLIIDDPGGALAAKVKAVFADPDPVRRYAAAESVALEVMRPFWPERPALDLLRLAPYADPYVASDKPIWLVGLSFDRETRKLVDCAAEPFGA